MDHRHTFFFWPHKDMEDLPGWVISPGPPPRQHKHERQYTPSTHSVIPTRRIWNDDDDGQMIFEDLGGLKFPDICPSGEEKPRKNLTQEICPDRGSNPGPLRDKRACYHLLHSGVQLKTITLINIPFLPNSAKLSSPRSLSALPRSRVSYTNVTDQLYSLPMKNCAWCT